ncbi:hypothetical protein B0J11DRAFT_45362 [Dendryphion nanum]|uniref:Uncharacterized protein n=1 Tax=Dendryphion nanum TaxID=256645 RepID=A0A9P9EH87_9PLEO|nr:hypothetical protein B0J11DRAFT_45362 [Dendryphion nanum]
MPQTNNRWILTNSCEFAPDGSLQLGQILADPKDPAYVLQPLGPLPLPPSIKPEITSRDDISIKGNTELSAQFSAWAQLGYVRTQSKQHASRSRTNEMVWFFKKLESRIISPDIKYVEGAMRHGDVEASLKNFRFKRRVYMVTGVRIVSGAHTIKSDISSSDVGISAKCGTSVQPVTAGVTGQFSSNSSSYEGFDKATDFVFAYRLNEIKYRGKLSHKPYTGGEVASTNEPRALEDDWEVTDFEVLGISDIPFTGKSADFDRFDVPDYENMESFYLKDA